MSKKMFDFVIGNPPYQGENENNGRKPPIYNIFMDYTYMFANTVELITPARFLFDAGQTPKSWNEKMLNDPHFKVLHYEPNSDVYFPSLSTPIKGGVVISIRDNSKADGPIKVFTAYEELNTITKKILTNTKDGIFFVNFP